MRHNLRISAILALILVSLTLLACETQPEAPSVPGMLLLATPAQTYAPCEACARATLAAALTQERNNAENQAAATAAIERANAQATLNSANATLGAAQTQEQNNANVVAAQVAATAAIIRANAQATLVAAGSTQNAALTQDAVRQTQVQYSLQVTADSATQNAMATVTQQNNNFLAASTQTAVANNIATQTQSAAATSQWYTDQSRQREEKRQGPIAFLWMWCLPIFVVMLAGLVLWGFWRWLKIRQANQRILENPVDKLPAPAAEIIHHQQDASLPYLDGDVVDDRYQLARPDDQVRRWLDEVKRKLLSSDKKDEEDGSTDN